MPYRRRPYGRGVYARTPYVRSPYGLSAEADGLIFNAPLLTSLDEVFGATPSFARASIATYIGADGLLKTAASGEPRFDYDPGGGARGYLTEGARTNAMPGSETFDVGWTPTRASVSANAATAPDGTNTADSLVEDLTPNNTHELQRDSIAFTQTDNTVQSFSVYAKPNSRQFIYLVTVSRSGSTARTWFDIQNGTIGTTAGAHTPRIELAPQGYYRCSVAYDIGAGGSTPVVRVSLADTDGQTNYTGNGTSGVFLWGAQYEVDSPFPSSYVPTAGAAVARAADILSYPLTSVSGVTLQAVVESFAPTGGNAQEALSVDAGTVGDSSRIALASGGAFQGITAVGAATQSSLTVGAWNSPTLVTYRAFENDFQVFAQGSASANDTSGSIPTATNVRIGDSAGAPTSSPQWGHTNSVKIYDRPLGAGEV